MRTLSKFLCPVLLACLLPAAAALAIPGDENYSPATADPGKVLDYGQGLYESGKYSEALVQFRTVLEKDPGNDRANYLAGLSYMGLDNAAQSIQYFQRALARNNFLYAAREQLGLAYLKQGEAEQANKQLGILSRQLGRCGDECDMSLKTAVESLKNAIEHDGEPLNTGSAWQQPEQRGRLQASVTSIHRHDFAHAIVLLKRTLAITGEQPDVLNYLGYANRKLGRYDIAIGYYRRALAVDPGHLGANEYLGELYVEIGDLDRARMQLARLDRLCAFDCYARQELARWIKAGATNRLASSDRH